MQVGDLVKHFLTEQIGIVMTTHVDPLGYVRVIWTTQGKSLLDPGGKEWCCKNSLDLLTTA